MSEWRVPKPHEVLGFFFSAASVLLVVGIFGHDTKGEKLLMAIVLLTGTGARMAAARHIPTRVQNLLDARDELVEKALQQTVNGKHGGQSDR